MIFSSISFLLHMIRSASSSTMIIIIGSFFFSPEITSGRLLYSSKFLARVSWNKPNLRSISFIAQLKAFIALSASVITLGSIKCGKPLYIENSTRFGSIKINLKSSGEVLYIKLIKMPFRHTLLPEFVAPATKRCGIFARLQSLILPAISLPKAKASGFLLL